MSKHISSQIVIEDKFIVGYKDDEGVIHPVMTKAGLSVFDNLNSAKRSLRYNTNYRWRDDDFKIFKVPKHVMKEIYSNVALLSEEVKIDD